MQLTVNGQPRVAADDATLEQLLAQLGIPASTAVAEVNGEIVYRGQFTEHALCEGDKVELVTIVGGG